MSEQNRLPCRICKHGALEPFGKYDFRCGGCQANYRLGSLDAPVTNDASPLAVIAERVACAGVVLEMSNTAFFKGMERGMGMIAARILERSK